MPSTLIKSQGKSLSQYWNQLDAFGRLRLILDHADAFLRNHLVSRSEIDTARVISLSNWEYMLEREKNPLFTTIHIKDGFSAQARRDRLRTALQAVFL